MPTTLWNLRPDPFPRPMSVLEAGGECGHSAGPFTVLVVCYGPRLHFDLQLDPGTLPIGARVELECPGLTTRATLASALVGFERARRAADSSDRYVLTVTNAVREIRPGIFGIEPRPDPIEVGLYVQLPPPARSHRYEFQLEHWVGNARMGARSFVFRGRVDRAA